MDCEPRDDTGTMVSESAERCGLPIAYTPDGLRRFAPEDRKSAMCLRRFMIVCAGTDEDARQVVGTMRRPGHDGDPQRRPIG